jgi:hypothetical protein
MGGPGSGRKKGSGNKSSKGLNKTSSRPYLKAARKAKKQDAMLENFNPNRFKK